MMHGLRNIGIPAESSNVCYLLSILYSRLKDDGKAVSSFMRSLELDGSKAYRGRLDPKSTADNNV